MEVGKMHLLLSFSSPKCYAFVSGWILVWLLLLWLDTIPKGNLKEERGLFQTTLPSSSALLRAAGAGNEGEATQNIAYWLACWLLPKPMDLQASCTALVHLPRDDNVHIWLASPTPVINEGNVPQTPTAQSDLDSSSAEVCSSFALEVWTLMAESSWDGLRLHQTFLIDTTVPALLWQVVMNNQQCLLFVPSSTYTEEVFRSRLAGKLNKNNSFMKY